MNKKTKWAILATLVPITFMLAFYLTLPGHVGFSHPSFKGVNLADVINDPNLWQGQDIRVSGYFNLELEGDAIYLTENDRNAKKIKNSVSLSLESKDIGVFDKINHEDASIFNEALRVRRLIALRKMVGKLVKVEGTFKTENFGGLSSGTIYANYICSI